MISLAADKNGRLTLFIGAMPVFDENSEAWVSPMGKFIHFEEVSPAEVADMCVPRPGELALLFSICPPTKNGIRRCPFYETEGTACNFVPSGPTDLISRLPEAEPFIRSLAGSKEANKRALVCEGYLGPDCFWMRYCFKVIDI